MAPREGVRHDQRANVRGNSLAPWDSEEFLRCGGRCHWQVSLYGFILEKVTYYAPDGSQIFIQLQQDRV